MTRSHPSPTRTSQRGRIALWLGGGIVLAAALIGGAFIGYWVFINVVVHITLKDQPAAIRLPETVHATARVTNVLDITMNGKITTAVPFEADLKIPFDGQYDFHVVMSPTVPVQFTVTYDGVIPIDTMAHITAKTSFNYKNLKKIRNLKVQTSIPLDFNLPVHLEIPVDDTINLKYEGPITATIHDALSTHVDTVLHAKLPVNQTIRSPVTAAIPLKVQLPQKPIRTVINYAQIALKPTELAFQIADRKSVTDQPGRMPSPFGPAAPDNQSEHSPQ